MYKPFVELLHFLGRRLITSALLEIEHEVVQRLEGNQRFAMCQRVLADEASRLRRWISGSVMILIVLATHI